MRRSFIFVLVLGLIAAACNGDGDEDGTAATPTNGEQVADECDPPPLKEEGVFVVAAEYPYYEPFLIGDQADPTGFEADLINGIAERLGVDEVRWENIAFDQLYAPGPKQWDVGVSEITITEERDEVVDFSAPYFEANQGILVRADSEYANATSTEELLDARFGAEAGTTGLDYIRAELNLEQPPNEFDTTEATAQALRVGTIDVQIIDVPIAIGIRDGSEDVELEVIGEFITEEEYGLTMEEGSELKPCVDAAIEDMQAAGELEQSQEEFFPGTTELPEFEPAR